jgi:UDP-N-acetylmuramyl pentapeptide phosphotransferase/UDP-N-acetylglucosamine-1-phosphate transferase
VNAFFDAAARFLSLSAPWWGLFAVSFLLSLVLTHFARGLARRLKMVDMPSARRINKTPVPRGGGVAIFASFVLVIAGYVLATGACVSPLFSNETFFRMGVLAFVLVVVGLWDDKFGLSPVVKLLGQVVVAFGVFVWCDVSLGVALKCGWLPVWADGVITVLWIVGAVNAFNLIDGLDGLATGVATIAAVGMGGALFFIGYPQATLVYMVFVGACLGFLRYNFNPASVLLGDAGSMFLGFALASLPLMTKSVDSLFVGVGVPMLAMGVPIFDTALAIMRRSLRALLRHMTGDDAGSAGTHVMQVDTDHLHHRLLRSFVSQKKVAAILYVLSGFLVAVALGALVLRDRAAGLFVLAFMVAVVVIVCDMRRVELWDAGRLLDAIVHDQSAAGRRRRLLAVPFYIVMDVLLLVFVFFLMHLVCGIRIGSYTLHTALPLRVVPVFFCLVLLRTYYVVWSRALIVNYLCLVAACLVGTVSGSAIIVLLRYPHSHLIIMTVLFFVLSVLALVGLRLVRPVVRDLFYHVGHGRLIDNVDSSRVIVYGVGLRYGMFHRELVRSTSRNRRVVVGLLDDDVALCGFYVGSMRVHGGLEQAPEVIRRLRADEVVIACDMPPERLAHARRVFTEAGAKVSLWSCGEREL